MDYSQIIQDILYAVTNQEDKTKLLLINRSTLGPVEWIWHQLRLSFNPFWMSSVITTLFLITLYVVLNIHWALIYHFKPAFLWKYKIQKKDEKKSANKKENPTDWTCIKTLLFGHVCVLFPLSFFNYPLLVLGCCDFDVPFPSWTEMLLRSVFYFIAEDFFFYWGHRWLHTDWAYRNIHYLHHTYEAPIAMASSYAHSAELIILGIGSFVGPFTLGMFMGQHLFGWWVWMTVRQIEALDVHSGFDFPWHLSKFLPFYCGPHHHDHHHKTYSGNYASTFTWMDSIFGTDKSYRDSMERKARKAAKSQ